MKCLNLGCGRRFHPAWTNVDFSASAPEVIAHDLRTGIPFPDSCFDVVYHSHVLEHFSRSAAAGFLLECLRVLRPGGILRVAVPDLELITRLYLEALDHSAMGSPVWRAHYEWLMLIMYDQATRTFPGGEMMHHLAREDLTDADFIVKLCGPEAAHLIKQGRQAGQCHSKETPRPPVSRRLWSRLWRMFVEPTYRRTQVRQVTESMKDRLAKQFLGQEYETLELGRFRKSGEVHQWMYDRHSLGTVLTDCGFREVTRQTAVTSFISDWVRFHLDTEPNGSVYKPESLYMEGKKTV